ncbi:C40 family peptidase [Ammoniphilus sp. 3BR4]|uniref:C40 family peptidase n=1 Tax=Ammoniphilus sp. 3BR4 TaxID=3158265 RepID=UPI0034678F38
MKKMISVLTLALGIGIFGSGATFAGAETLSNNNTAGITATSTKAQKIIALGKRYLGVDYDFGGDRPKEGFDCQGFTKYVFGKYGVKLPFGARNQSKVGKYVSRKNLKPGDLVFFSTSKTTKYSSKSIKRIGHVGIYIGNGKVLHTYGDPGVTINNFRSGWWDKHYVTARRVL